MAIKNKYLEMLDPVHQKFSPFTHDFTLHIWQEKYRYGEEASPLETFERVAKAIALGDAALEQSFYDAMSSGLWMPGGRIIAGAGTDKRVTLMNCLGGRERVTTQEYGTITLEEATKFKHVTLLTSSGWIKSEVRCFGLQHLNKITLRPSRSKHRKKVVYATTNHRWFTPTMRTITELRPGLTLASCTVPVNKKSSDYREGLFHGIVFGDGQLHRTTLREVSGGYPLGTFHHVLRACGRVTEYYELLDTFCSNYKQPPAAKGDRIYYHHGDINLKTVPTTDKSCDYYAGFIDGWWVADGHYENGDTQRCVSSTNYEQLNWLVTNAHRGGYVATGDKITGKKVTNLGVAKDPCRAITIREAAHTFWTVESIEPVGISPVYCAIVPDVHAFSLTEGLYTGNCYVNKTIDDSLDDIMSGVSIAALTQQQGGGIGTDFSTLRPEGAILRRTGARASGPLPFMDMWHAMCQTIMSAGDRRGAMMGTLSDTHPDLLKFIKAKQEPGRLTNFNISILISDAFMEAVKEDAEWYLHFPVEPYTRTQELRSLDFRDDDGIDQFVYSTHSARALWELITKNTYEFSEPGVIFIDRVNDLNNLKYCEEIHCTNPCGEQPLPANGTCNLGAINLSRLVSNPFRENAEFEFTLLRQLSHLGMQFLDNVIEVTNYPLPEQRDEEFQKRRTGLGVSGLADCLSQLGLRYGSQKAVEMTEKIFYTLSQSAYSASIELAKKKGSFPLFDANDYLDNTFAGTRCDHSVVDHIREHGIRNGVLLTVAPTGTTSILFGDISSGIEPVLAHEMDRNVRQSDNSFKSYKTSNYGYRLYKTIFPNSKTLPAYMVTVDELSINDHVAMQAAVQRWIDASVSKTVNVAKDLPYEQFIQVYELAYQLGCKGCTTYRPSDVRGTIISKSGAGPETLATTSAGLLKRPDELQGVTRRIKWPTLTSSLYLTVNYLDEAPHEVFFNSKDARLHDWMVATSLMITSLLRKGGDIVFIAEELMQVQSLHDTAFIQGPGDAHPKNYSSLISLVGAHLQKLLQPRVMTVQATAPALSPVVGERCLSCGGMTMFRNEGCKTCVNCGYSDCG